MSTTEVDMDAQSSAPLKRHRPKKPRRPAKKPAHDDSSPAQPAEIPVTSQDDETCEKDRVFLEKLVNKWTAFAEARAATSQDDVPLPPADQVKAVISHDAAPLPSVDQVAAASSPDDGFIKVVGKRKPTATKKPAMPAPSDCFKARKHPAAFKPKNSTPKVQRDPTLLTILVRPSDKSNSLHKLSNVLFSRLLKELNPAPVGLRRIFGGGYAFDFPAGTNLASFLKLKCIGSLPVTVSLPRAKQTVGTIRGDFGSAEEVKELY